MTRRFIREHLAATILPFSLLAIADMIGKLLAFLTIPMITRRFGDSAFGDIGVASQMMVFAVLVGTCGLDVYSVRTVARNPVAFGRWASTVMLMRLSLGAIVYAALIAIAMAVPQYRAVALLVAVFGLSLFTRALYLDFGLIMLVIAVRGSVWSVALAQVIAEGICAATVLGWFHRHAAPLERPLPVREWPGLLRQSLPFAGSQVFRGASLGLDLVLLSYFVVPREQIGWFSGAFKLFQLCSGTAAVYFLILLPRLSASAARSDQALRQELRHSSRLILPLAALAALIVGLFAKPLLHHLGGHQAFEQASTSLQILLLAVVVGVANGHYRNALFALGRQHADFGNVTISAVCHLALKVALIPRFGIAGVALGTLGGELVLTLLGMRSVHRHATPDSGSPPDLPLEQLPFSVAVAND
jgi:O-antigen/teichoic acid export membrane protein